jgi:hypothetical protein
VHETKGKAFSPALADCVILLKQWALAMALGCERTFAWLDQFRRLRLRYENGRTKPWHF